MKDIKAIKGKYYLQRLIAEGEHDRQDFKFAISDARKIARSLSAFANAGGGHLLIGVKDNGAIAGVRNEEDIYVIEQAATLYCRPVQQLRFTAYKADEGAVVIKAEIDRSETRPVMAMDTDGCWKAFYRVADENITASPLMVKAWRGAVSGRPMTITLGPAEDTLLSMIRRDGHSTAEKFMVEARISRKMAEDTIVRLFAVGVIDFRHIDREFVIVGTDC